MGGVLSLFLSISLLLTSGIMSAIASANSTDRCGETTETQTRNAAIVGIVLAVLLFMMAIFIPGIGIYISGGLAILALFITGILSAIASASAGKDCPDKTYDMSTYSAIIGIVGGALATGAMFLNRSMIE